MVGRRAMRLPLHAAARRGNVSTTRAPLRAGTRDVLPPARGVAAARDFTLLGLPLLALAARRHRAGGSAGLGHPSGSTTCDGPTSTCRGDWRAQGATAPCFFGACLACKRIPSVSHGPTSTCTRRARLATVVP